MRILSVQRALPDHAYDQATLLQHLQELWGERFHNPQRLQRLHSNVLVGGRRLALEAEEYRQLDTFGKANDAWIREAEILGERALDGALQRAQLPADQLRALTFVSVTGVATPSVDARLVDRMGLAPNIKRTPIFGLGCVAGAAGLARVSDYLRAFPTHCAALLSVELCSLTLQQGDFSVANLIATGLFGDGAAAVVLAGEDHPAAKQSRGPRVVATRSSFYPGTQDVMGWKISEQGFQVVLSPDVPEMARHHLARDVDSFLRDHDLERSDIRHWICHTGGPKVLSAMEEALELPSDALELSWRSLKEVGNLSSASVLLVLEETLERASAQEASWGLLLAMGPGFCSELVLLRW
ncbi:MAG: 3-oxoacyl-[acyl-carrier-protein] synthase III C-terminal domain-containing protein [Acidobacteriota bacterium]